jgi:cytochrome oxidase Cu insertion factor (SCO1/SenC/PrrC family)
MFADLAVRDFRVLKAMGNDADRVNAWFVSVDPERDTAAAMKGYLSSFDPPEGPDRRSAAVAKVSAYRVYARKSRSRTATTPWTTPRCLSDG